MSQDPLLDKMDALLKRHRGNETGLPAREASVSEPIQAEEPAAPPPDAWLPVLTDVVVMGSFSSSQVTEVSESPEAELDVTQSTFPPPEPSQQTEQPPMPVAEEPHAISDTMAEQLMGELEPKLSALLQNKISSQIHNSLDDTVSALLAQLDVNIREIVREAINERLGKP